MEKPGCGVCSKCGEVIQCPECRDVSSSTETVGYTPKPPIGLKPKGVHNHQRYLEVCSAIARYYNAGMKIPLEWIEEHNSLID